METKSDIKLRTLLDRRTPGHSLEQEFYTSDSVFQADLEFIFGRHWIYVGVEPDVSEPGDVMTIEIGTASILIIRDDNAQVRAFHNVCRHRGARLVDDAKTSVGNLVCRYHAWTYNLEGTLLFADHMTGDFDKSCRGLKPVHIRSVAGLLFICLSDTPPVDIDEMSEVITPYILPHDVVGCKVAHTSEIVEDGNWKLTMENNRECYHCTANHPELMNALFAFGFGYAPSEDNAEAADEARYREQVAVAKTTWNKAHLPSAEIEHLDDRPTGYRCERLIIDRHGESQTMDTHVASQKLLGTLTTPKLGGLSFWTQPNSWHHFMSDHIVTISAIPVGPEKTLVRTKWLVHKDAVEGVDYTVENLSAVWKATNHQDGDLVAMVQRGVRSPAYAPGPYSPFTEGLVEKFCSWYVARMSAELG